MGAVLHLDSIAPPLGLYLVQPLSSDPLDLVPQLLHLAVLHLLTLAVGRTTGDSAFTAHQGSTQGPEGQRPSTRASPVRPSSSGAGEGGELAEPLVPASRAHLGVGMEAANQRPARRRMAAAHMQQWIGGLILHLQSAANQLFPTHGIPWRHAMAFLPGC